MAWVAAVFLFLLAGYLFLIAPGRPAKGTSLPRGHLYAHRGLHDNEKDVPENSLAAFQRAAEMDYGIELDVQMTADGQLVIFHDRTLMRMCGADVRLSEIFLRQVLDYPLLGTSMHIPLLSEVLELVDGRVPLLVEIKAYDNTSELAGAAHQALSKYNGPYCVESFHPLVLRWFKKNAPSVARGQLASGVVERGESRLAQWALKYLLVNALSRPHFIAYDIRSGENVSTFLARRLFKPLWAAWTVRTPGEMREAGRKYDLQIFEGFAPRR